MAARATVTRSNLELPGRFDQILGLGFIDVGFSPVRRSGGADELGAEDWPRYLAACIELGRRELDGALEGGPIRFANFAVALKQLWRSSSMPYPCGAGGGYFSVATDGTWYACHRAIGDRTYALGDNQTLDEPKRAQFLRERHVHSQAECRRCWARYLCSGICHQEASARSDSSSGFIRGWLDFCLEAYCELLAGRPEWFRALARPAHDMS